MGHDCWQLNFFIPGSWGDIFIQYLFALNSLRTQQMRNDQNYFYGPSHISTKLLVVLAAYIYIKLANCIHAYFHSMSISAFSSACISNHLLTSYHSRNLEFLIPWISTGQESRPPFMHRNQFSHHYTMHQNNILRAKVEASGIEPKHLSSKGNCSGIFNSKQGRSLRLNALLGNRESLMGCIFSSLIWNFRLCAQEKC